MQQAEEIYNAQEWPPVDVSVLPHTNCPLEADDVAEVASSLSVLVRTRLPAPNSYHRVEGRYNRKEIPEPIHSFRILHQPSLERSRFHYGRGSWVGNLNVEEVQSRLDDKNDRCPDYRESCDRVWIIIVIDGVRASSATDVRDEVKNAAYRFNSDRAFLFEALHKKITELKAGGNDRD